MKRMLAVFALVAMAFVGSTAAWAADQTARLRVNMSGCSSCASIAAGILDDVQGVSNVDVSFGGQLAVVTFDDRQTDAAAMVQVATKYGLPAKILVN